MALADLYFSPFLWHSYANGLISWGSLVVSHVTNQVIDCGYDLNKKNFLYHLRQLQCFFFSFPWRTSLSITSKRNGSAVKREAEKEGWVDNSDVFLKHLYVFCRFLHVYIGTIKIATTSIWYLFFNFLVPSIENARTMSEHATQVACGWAGAVENRLIKLSW